MYLIWWQLSERKLRSSKRPTVVKLVVTRPNLNSEPLPLETPRRRPPLARLAAFFEWLRTSYTKTGVITSQGVGVPATTSEKPFFFFTLLSSHHHGAMIALRSGNWPDIGGCSPRVDGYLYDKPLPRLILFFFGRGRTCW